MLFSFTIYATIRHYFSFQSFLIFAVGNRGRRGASPGPRRPPGKDGRILHYEPGAQTNNKLKMSISDVLTEQLNRIERNTLLAAKNVLSLDDVSLLTGLSKSHLYKLTCTRQIPFYKPGGKNVYFDRAEVEAWMKQNRVNTEQEAQGRAAFIIEREGL